MKKCPFCAEQIQDEAVVCRFCNRDLRPAPPPAPFPPQHGYPATPTYQAPTKTNGMAIASLVLGIVFLYGIGSILALVFGYSAKSSIDRSGGHETGRGMAVAGIVLGWVGIGILAVILIAVIGASSS